MSKSKPESKHLEEFRDIIFGVAGGGKGGWESQSLSRGCLEGRSAP